MGKFVNRPNENITSQQLRIILRKFYGSDLKHLETLILNIKDYIGLHKKAH